MWSIPPRSPYRLKRREPATGPGAWLGRGAGPVRKSHAAGVQKLRRLLDRFSRGSPSGSLFARCTSPLDVLLAFRSSFLVSVNSKLSKTRRTAPRACSPSCYPGSGPSGALRSGAGLSRAGRRSSGWPGQGPAAEDVPVDVRDDLARVGAGVEDDAIAALADPLLLRDAVHPGDHLAEQPAIRGGERRDVGIVLLRDDEHMRRGLRVDRGDPRRAAKVRLNHVGHG